MGEGTGARELVAVSLPPGPVLVEALRHAWNGGPALAPLSPALPPPARARLLEALRPARLVDGAGVSALPSPRGVPAEVALVIATSGSTGDPKGVELSRAALEASALAGGERLGLTAQDRWLCCLPVSAMGGAAVLVRSLVASSEPVVLPRFAPEAVARAEGVTAVSLVPTLLARLLDAGVDLTRFRHVLLGGAATPPALLARARAAGVRVTPTYGMTETCGGCVYDGVPLRGVEVSAAGGRIRVRGAVLASAYRGAGGREPVVGPDGWLATGDLGRLGADGRLEVLGRADDVIVTGGANVVAGRVAALLAAHPAVADAAVTGLPDPEWGQRVVAVVVPRDPVDPPALAALRDFVAERAPRHEAPRQLVLVDRLPLLDGGKLDRRALRRRAAEAVPPLGDDRC